MKKYYVTSVNGEIADLTGNVMLSGSTNPIQKEVTGTTYTILDSDDKDTIFFNSASAVTVTIDTLTIDGFTCDFYNLGAGTVTFQNGTATVGYPDGTGLATDKVCSLIRFMATTTYRLKGELV